MLVRFGSAAASALHVHTLPFGLNTGDAPHFPSPRIPTLWPIILANQQLGNRVLIGRKITIKHGIWQRYLIKRLRGLNAKGAEHFQDILLLNSCTAFKRGRSTLVSTRLSTFQVCTDTRESQERLKPYANGIWRIVKTRFEQ